MLRSQQAPGAKVATTRRPMGATFLSDPIGSSEADTLMCQHCGAHWQVQPGSGRKRGWCFNCDGPTCGKQACEETCVPLEAAIEEMERKDRNMEVLRGGR